MKESSEDPSNQTYRGGRHGAGRSRRTAAGSGNVDLGKSRGKAAGRFAGVASPGDPSRFRSTVNAVVAVRIVFPRSALATIGAAARVGRSCCTREDAPAEAPCQAADCRSPEVPQNALKGLNDSLKEIVLAKADSAALPRGAKPSVAPKFDVDVYNLGVSLSPVGNTAEIYVPVDETIGHYADWLGIPTFRIRQLNRMGARSDIRINKRLSIPADQATLEKFVKARLEYHMAIGGRFLQQI